MCPEGSPKPTAGANIGGPEKANLLRAYNTMARPVLAKECQASALINPDQMNSIRRAARPQEQAG